MYNQTPMHKLISMTFIAVSCVFANDLAAQDRDSVTTHARLERLEKEQAKRRKQEDAKRLAALKDEYKDAKSAARDAKRAEQNARKKAKEARDAYNEERKLQKSRAAAEKKARAN
jgi:hypothetical protein